MTQWHDAPGIRDDRTALPVALPDVRRVEFSAVDLDSVAYGDALAGKRGNGLDKGCKTARTQPAAEITSLLGLFELPRGWRADEHEIPNENVSA